MATVRNTIKNVKTGLLLTAATVMILGFSQRVEAGTTVIDSPNWEIEIDDFGYSDYLGDKRAGFNGRDYLSGEWGGAVGYKLGAGPTISPKWLTTNFEGPGWTTNSDFWVTSPTSPIGVNVYQSTIRNNDLEIELTTRILDTTTGIAKGFDPASNGGAGVSLTSDRYVLEHTYGITNISGENITNLKFYQLLVGDNSTESLYDNRNYGGALGNYHYDSTVNGVSYSWNDATGEFFSHNDAITLHTNTVPSGYESGDYVADDSDDWIKPTTGIHLSVESGSLNGVDYFAVVAPARGGVAQEHTLVNLAPGATATIDVLLSINSADDIAPWRPGDDVSDPILPEEVNETNDAWFFWFGATDGTMTFIDPEVAIGYDYYHGDPYELEHDEGDPYVPYSQDQNFQSVLLPHLDIGDDLYELYLFDVSSDSWVFAGILTAGVEYDFGPGGVDRFRILGIEEEAGLDPNDPSAFVTGLTLVTPGTIAVTMQSIIVPEPSTMVLLGTALWAMGCFRRGKRKGS